VENGSRDGHCQFASEFVVEVDFSRCGQRSIKDGVGSKQGEDDDDKAEFLGYSGTWWWFRC
jgi:hypothetical protein